MRLYNCCLLLLSGKRIPTFRSNLLHVPSRLKAAAVWVKVACSLVGG
jgi:hypothetical protein